MIYFYFLASEGKGKHEREKYEKTFSYFLSEWFHSPSGDENMLCIFLHSNTKKQCQAVDNFRVQFSRTITHSNFKNIPQISRPRNLWYIFDNKKT